MRAYSKNNLFLLLVIIIAVVVYHRWFSFNIFSVHDYNFLFNQILKDNVLFTTWVSNQEVGGVDAVLWRPTFSLFFGIIGVLTGRDANVADKFIVFWPMVFLSSLPAYYLVKRIIGSALGGFIGSLVFAYNTYFLAINSQGHVALVIAAGISIVAFLVFIEILEKRKGWLAVVLGLSLALVGYYDFRTLYMTMGILFLYPLINLKITQGHRQKTLFLVSLALITWLLLNIYWIVVFLDAGGTEEVLSRGLFGNNFWNLSDAMTLHHPFWNGSKPEWFILSPTPIYQWLIPIIAFLGFYFNRRNINIVFFGLLAIIGILLTKQADAPFTGLYEFLFEWVPGFSGFRESTKFYFLIVLSYAVLISSLIDWLWRYWTANAKQQLGTYACIVLTLGLFLWNTKPIVTGEIGTLYIPRSIPADYEILKDFISVQPDYFRTYWVPTYSRWGYYSNQHPRVNGVELLQSDWRDYINSNDVAEHRPLRNQITDFFREPFTPDLFNNAAIKYVIVPLENTADSDTNLFGDYGGNRQFYFNVLDSAHFLKKIDIGTQNLAVYENLTYQPPISAQSALIGLDSFNYLSSTFSFLENINIKEPSFYLPEDSSAHGAQLKKLFSKPELTSSISPVVVSDSVRLQKDTPAKLYKKVGATRVITEIENDNLTLNGEALQFTDYAPSQISSPAIREEFEIADVTLKAGDNRFELSNINYDGTNLINNASFENGLWHSAVGDCNAHDNNPDLDMKINTQHKTEGAQSLQLEATRHNACTSQDVSLTGGGNYVLSFDVQGENTTLAAYNLQFNDSYKTISAEVFDIEESGPWREFKKTIIVPPGTTTAILNIYAYESNGKAKNIVRYDNLKFIKVPALDKIYYLLTETDSALRVPAQITYRTINSTKKTARVSNATAPFVLSFAEGFHPQWRLYLKPMNEDEPCEPWRDYRPRSDNIEPIIWECASESRFMDREDISYLWQSTVFDDKHIKLNGYANGWIIDPAWLKANYGPEYVHQNADGSVDINLVIYFRSQSYFYIGLAISGVSLIMSLAYMLYGWYKQKARRAAMLSQK